MVLIIPMKIKITNIHCTNACKVIFSEIIAEIISRRVPCAFRNPAITLLNPRAILNLQSPTLLRLKGLRLRLMEPRTFEINCRRGNPFPVQTIYPEDQHGNVFRWDEKPRREWKNEQKKKGERSAVWMANRLKHNFNPFAQPYLFSFSS